MRRSGYFPLRSGCAARGRGSHTAAALERPPGIPAPAAGFLQSECLMHQGRRRRRDRHPGTTPCPRRIATLSVHTSPLEQPGTGDAGGMNVYIVEMSKRLAAAGTEVEIFTRATSSDLPPTVELAPGVLVRHVAAGPLEGAAQGGPRRPSCARSPPLSCAPRPATSPAGTTSCTPTTGCPARSGGWPRSAGVSRSSSRCTPWARSRTACSPTATPLSRGSG